MKQVEMRMQKKDSIMKIKITKYICNLGHLYGFRIRSNEEK